MKVSQTAGISGDPVRWRQKGLAEVVPTAHADRETAVLCSLPTKPEDVDQAHWSVLDMKPDTC